jgi:hypothetical protein
VAEAAAPPVGAAAVVAIGVAIPSLRRDRAALPTPATVIAKSEPAPKAPPTDPVPSPPAAAPARTEPAEAGAKPPVARPDPARSGTAGSGVPSAAVAGDSTPRKPSVESELATPHAAKNLFYAKEAAPSTAGGTVSAGTGLQYRVIRRSPSGQEVDVAPDTTFTAGDRVRLAIVPNIDGYLYVVAEGSSGQWRVLFPSPQINNGLNTVRRFEPHVVPSGGSFVFDEQPGTERLFVLLSKEPLRQLPGFNEPVTQVATVEPSLIQQLSRELKSRDLIFQQDTARENDGRSNAAPVAYVVNRDQLAPHVATTISLVHK